MRAITLAALVLAGCTAGPGGTPARATPGATVAPATPAAVSPTPRPSAPPTASPVPATAYTADDEEIATRIREGAEEAIPQLKLLNGMDPGKLEDLFLPLAAWIADQRAAVAAITPSSCTAGAVELFIEGLDAYDDIRETFMGWRDWGAHGHPFPRGAPPQAVAILEEAVAELEVHCPT